jgi:hypothetical protein
MSTVKRGRYSRKQSSDLRARILLEPRALKLGSLQREAAAEAREERSLALFSGWWEGGADERRRRRDGRGEKRCHEGQRGCQWV